MSFRVNKSHKYLDPQPVIQQKKSSTLSKILDEKDEDWLDAQLGIGTEKDGVEAKPPTASMDNRKGFVVTGQGGDYQENRAEHATVNQNVGLAVRQTSRAREDYM